MRSALSLLVSAVLVGIGAGIVGAGLMALLHLVQHAAYGYQGGSVLGTETFLEGVTAASALRRVGVLFACGIVAGLGWEAVARFGHKLVPVEDAVRSDDPRMPLGTTVVDGLLQVMTVGLGSPLGREVAPREVAAAFGAWVTRRAGLPPQDRSLLVACAAGAGLAAVYNVPLGGAVFTLEVLLATLRPAAVVAAVVSSALSALVVRLALHDPRAYALDPFAVGLPLTAWSVIVGPILGLGAVGFARAARSARAHPPRGGRILVWCAPTFLAIGGLSYFLPEILGNGKSVTQMGLSDQVGVGLAVTLLACRLVLPILSLRAGARGGLLTPSVAVGALLGLVLGAAWDHVSPGVPHRAFALVGAAAFLASSQGMPLTAMVLLAELARVDFAAILPMMLAVGGSAWVTAALKAVKEPRAIE